MDTTADPMAAIRQTFFQECEEQLAEAEAGLLAMSDAGLDDEIVNAVFRAVHSIKGGAGAFKLDRLVAFSHKFETALDSMRSGRLEPKPEVFKIMLRASGTLADLVAAANIGKDIDEASYAGVAEDIRSLVHEDESQVDEVIDFSPTMIDFDEPDVVLPLAGSRNRFSIEFAPRDELYAHANEPVLVLKELSLLGDVIVDCHCANVPLLDRLNPEASYLSWSIHLETDIDQSEVTEVFEFVSDDAQLEISCNRAAQSSDIEATALPDCSTIENAHEAANSSEALGEHSELSTDKSDNLIDAVTLSAGLGESKGGAQNSGAASSIQSTIRVEFDRVDRLINLVGELVINQAMLSQRVAEANFAGASAILMGLDELEQLTREIQESVMAIRAQPVKPLFQRMSRIVRDVADATGKQVRLKTEGESTEVDKTVVERLAEPLTHMIRNAVDHGIESPEIRIANGKPPEGLVKLIAAHRAGRIVIEISDDGAGINRLKVRQSAIDKKLIAPDAALSDSEIDNLLFLPGFSTAGTISNISGRGVGMDVVKRSIQALGGRISISSRPGQGSAFSLSLPLTLAVLDGMVVSVCDQTFVVPLTSIVETLKPKGSDVHALGAEGRVMAIRNVFVPFVDVAKKLGFRTGRRDPQNGVAILVETEDGGRSALLVDSIQDQRQVVIKSLEANYRSIPGIAAATILGDGRVALILDVNGLINRPGTESSVDLQMAIGG